MLLYMNHCRKSVQESNHWMSIAISKHATPVTAPTKDEASKVKHVERHFPATELATWWIARRLRRGQHSRLDHQPQRVTARTKDRYPVKEQA